MTRNSPSLFQNTHYTPHTTITSFQCVVALTDQWYLAYGDPEWADKVSQHIHSKEFNGYNDKIMESFDHVRTAHFSLVKNIVCIFIYIIVFMKKEVLFFFFTVVHYKNMHNIRVLAFHIHLFSVH
jgi:hypothetical protein